MKFGLRPAHLGGVEVQLEMKDGKLNAQINADNPMTRELLQNSSQRLREALANLGVQTNQVSVGQNQSGSTQTGSQGQNGGNQSQVGDNLTSSASPNEGTTEINRTTSTKGSDSLLDLYA
jgi:flagellar hook-length control protein FliK